MKLSSTIGGLAGMLFIAVGASAAIVSSDPFGHIVQWDEIDNGGAATRTINIYVQFDNPLDELNAAGSTASNPASINVYGGTFFHHSFESSPNYVSPDGALIPPFPWLAYDTFLSIGALSNTAGNPDQTTFTPGFPEFGASQWSSGDAMWSVPPGTPQGVAGNSILGDGKVLLGRLSANSMGPGSVEFYGDMTIQGYADGEFFDIDTTFGLIVPSPAAGFVLMFAGLPGRRRRV